jgi:uncharacterized membrane protein
MRIAVVVCAATLVLLALAPALHQPLVSIAVLAFFSRACHEEPSRSLWLAGVAMAVCARCFGIYVGAAIGVVVRVQRQQALQILAAALALNALDVLTEAAGLHADLPALRVCMGVALGVAVAAVLTATSQGPQVSQLAT